MPRTLEEIQETAASSQTLRGLVSVLNDKLQLRSRYALLEYEAALEGHSESSDLFRSLHVSESDAIARLLDALVLETENGAFEVRS